MKKEEPPSVTTDVVTSSPRQRPLTPERLVAMYHESIPPGHPKVTVLSPERKKHAAAYLRTFPDESFWRAVFGEIWHSPFLRGEKASPGHRPVKRGFDWFLQKGKDDGLENCVKTFEGRYRDSPEDHRRECLSPSEYRSTLAGDRFVERGYEETRRSESFSDGDDAVIDGIQYRIE